MKLIQKSVLRHGFSMGGFGPFAPAKRRFSLLEIGKNKNDNKKKSSQTASRATEKVGKDVEQENYASGERGISFSNQISLANLEMKRETVTQQKKDSQIIAMNI
jgi:hypothetical protein